MGRSVQPQDQYIVRMPDGMRDQLKSAAADNKRSLNAEIIARIEAYSSIEWLKKEMERLRAERERAERLFADDLHTDIDATLKALLPAGLLSRIGEAAKASRRPVLEEIVQALEQAFPVVEELDRMIAALETVLKPLANFSPQTAEQATHLSVMRGHLMQMQHARSGKKIEVDAALEAFYGDFPGFRAVFYPQAQVTPSSQSVPEPSSPKKKGRSSAKVVIVKRDDK